MSVPERPLLKPWYRVRADRGRVLLEYAHRLTVLEGGAAERLLPALLPLLDGRRTVDEILATLGRPVEPAVRAALATLVHAGALTDGPPLDGDLPPATGLTASLLASTSGEDIPPSEAAARLCGCSVALLGAAETAGEIERLLRSSGVGSVERPTSTAGGPPLAGFDLVLAAPAPSELDLLDDVNRAALELGCTWLPVVPFDGVLAAIGPLVVPHESACWECVRLRRGSATGYAEELALVEPVPAVRPSCPPLDATVAGLAATAALRWLVQRDASLPGLLLALEQWPAVRVSSHTVYRLPRCPACSQLAGKAAPAPWSEAPAA